MYFLNVFKPQNITSFDIIRKLRKILDIRAVGHSGTLDPLASGVLQVAVGDATKLLDYLPSDKTYVADIKFGYKTSTFDSEGEKYFVKEPDFSCDDLKKILDSYVGISKQIAPIYSALKINGKKMCDIARESPHLILTPKEREIEIYSIELLDFNLDKAKISVKTKKGVYVRSLINDIGEKLSCGAYMSNLVRTQAGNFKLEDSNSVDGNLVKINPLDALEYPQYELNELEFKKISHGNFILNKNNINSDIILLTKNNRLVSVAKIVDNLIKPKRYFKE